MRAAALVLVLGVATVSLAQGTATLSPTAAYEEATRPIEIVHRSVTNWSDSETASLAVAIRKGAEACAARKPADFAGDQLIAYARLCSLGVNWPMVNVAATQYIESSEAAKPQLALAYGMKLEAVLQTHSVPDIMATAKAMLAANPYDATLDAASNEAFSYLQLAYTSDALKLYAVRAPILLAMIASDKPAVPLHTLYGDGLAWAALEQYAGLPEEAEATVAALEDTLAQRIAADTATRSPIPADELVLVHGLRRQYDLLGKPLPKLTLELSLADLNAKPAIDPEAGAATALLVFPPWCAQCVRMTADELKNAVTTLDRGAVRLYTLLAEPMPKPAELTQNAKTPAPLTATAQLLHTPTIVVPAETLDTLHVTDFPWLIVTDHAGVVRFAAVAPETALRPGEFVDRATDHVAEQWPSKFVPVASPAVPAP